MVFAGGADSRCYGDSSAVGFIQTRVAVVVFVTNPASRDASTIEAVKLIRFAFLCAGRRGSQLCSYQRKVSDYKGLIQM